MEGIGFQPKILALCRYVADPKSAAPLTLSMLQVSIALCLLPLFLQYLSSLSQFSKVGHVKMYNQ